MWQMLVKYFFYFVGRVRATLSIHPWTVEYPHVVRALPVRSHTSLKNNFSECIGCLKCEAICPVHAIEIQSYEYPTHIRRPQTSTGRPFEREVEKFRVDYNTCVFCGLCVQACPTESLTFAKSFLKPEFQSQALSVDLVHMPRSMRKGQFVEKNP